jgi:hypothetical protein
MAPPPCIFPALCAALDHCPELRGDQEVTQVQDAEERDFSCSWVMWQEWWVPLSRRLRLGTMNRTE